LKKLGSRGYGQHKVAYKNWEMSEKKGRETRRSRDIKRKSYLPYMDERELGSIGQ
jgi:hypothetical protein